MRSVSRRSRFLSLLANHLPATVWAILIFTASSISTPPSVGPEFVMKDKVVHMLVYCIFGVLLQRSFSTMEKLAPRSVLLALAVGIAYGALDEFHQYFVPGRDSSVYDFVADGAGVGLSVVVKRILHMRGVS